MVCDLSELVAKALEEDVERQLGKTALCLRSQYGVTLRHDLVGIVAFC